SRDETAHGRIWHAPTNPPRTQAQAVTDVLASVGRAPVPVRMLPRTIQRPLGLVWPMMRGLNQLSYQRNRPYILDDSATRDHFDLEPTPWSEVCRRTAEGCGE